MLCKNESQEHFRHKMTGQTWLSNKQTPETPLCGGKICRREESQIIDEEDTVTGVCAHTCGRSI